MWNCLVFKYTLQTGKDHLPNTHHITLTKHKHTYTFIYILYNILNSKINFWCQQLSCVYGSVHLFYVHSMVDSKMTIHFISWQISNTRNAQIFTPICLVHAMVILWYLAVASEDEPPRPVGLGNMNVIVILHVETVRPTQNMTRLMVFNKVFFIF